MHDLGVSSLRHIQYTADRFSIWIINGFLFRYFLSSLLLDYGNKFFGWASQVDWMDGRDGRDPCVILVNQMGVKNMYWQYESEHLICVDSRLWPIWRIAVSWFSGTSVLWSSVFYLTFLVSEPITDMMQAQQAGFLRLCLSVCGTEGDLDATLFLSPGLFSSARWEWV